MLYKAHTEGPLYTHTYTYAHVSFFPVDTGGASQSPHTEASQSP